MKHTPTFLFVGSYAAADEPGIHLFQWHESGALVARGGYAGVWNPSFVLRHPHQPWLYAVAETSQGQERVPGGVWALRWQADAAALEPINQRAAAGDAPCHLQMDRAGRWLLVSNYVGGSVAVFPIGGDGALGERAALVQHQGHSINPERQESAHLHSTCFSPDEQFVITADLGLDELGVYAFDGATGQLQPYRTVKTKPGAGPRHMAFHPRGRSLYVTNELDNTVTVYGYEAGQLHERQTLDTLPPDAPASKVAHILVAPSGRHLYVSNRGHDSIATFAIGPDERLERVALTPCGGETPRHFNLSPDGRFLLAANQDSGHVAVLAVEDGVAAAVIARYSVPGASCLQW